MVGNKAQKAIAAALTGAMTLGMAAPALALTQVPNTWSRADGTYNVTLEINGIQERFSRDGVNRYDTMFDVVSFNEINGIWGENGVVEAIVIASGENYPDALAAASLAGAYKAPIITTKAGALTPEGRKLVEYYASKLPTGELKVFVVGGENSVSKELVADLNKVQNTWVKRIDGTDRMDTSLELAEWERNIQGTNADFRYVIIANGYNPWDALSASTIAYENNASIILTDAAGNLSQDEIDWINDNRFDGTIGSGGIEQIFIIGGSSSVSAGVRDALEYDVDMIHVLGGANRYETSAKVAKYAAVTWGSYETVGVATGQKYPDALVGGAFIGARNGILVLADETAEGGTVALDALKDANIWWIGPTQEDNDDLLDLEKYGFIIGGTSSVSENLEDFLNRYIQPQM